MAQSDRTSDATTMSVREFVRSQVGPRLDDSNPAHQALAPLTFFPYEPYPCTAGTALESAPAIHLLDGLDKGKRVRALIETFPFAEADMSFVPEDTRVTNLEQQSVSPGIHICARLHHCVFLVRLDHEVPVPLAPAPPTLRKRKYKENQEGGPIACVDRDTHSSIETNIPGFARAKRATSVTHCVMKIELVSSRGRVVGEGSKGSTFVSAWALEPVVWGKVSPEHFYGHGLVRDCFTRTVFMLQFMPIFHAVVLDFAVSVLRSHTPLGWRPGSVAQTVRQIRRHNTHGPTSTPEWHWDTGTESSFEQLLWSAADTPDAPMPNASRKRRRVREYPLDESTSGVAADVGDDGKRRKLRISHATPATVVYEEVTIQTLVQPPDLEAINELFHVIAQLFLITLPGLRAKGVVAHNDAKLDNMMYMRCPSRSFEYVRRSNGTVLRVPISRRIVPIDFAWSSLDKDNVRYVSFEIPRNKHNRMALSSPLTDIVQAGTTLATELADHLDYDALSQVNSSWARLLLVARVLSPHVRDPRTLVSDKAWHEAFYTGSSLVTSLSDEPFDLFESLRYYGPLPPGAVVHEYTDVCRPAVSLRVA